MVDTATQIAVSKSIHTLVGTRPTCHKEVIPMSRDFLLSLCSQNPELEARRLASESIPVGTVSGERLPDKDAPIVHMVPPWRMRLYHKYGV